MNKLKEQIDFMVFQTLLEIRSNFKWSEFKKLQDQAARMNYLKKTGTEMLGKGSSRAVFLLSNRYVLKMALPVSLGQKIETGLAQNKEEVNLATDSDVNLIVAPIYDMAPDFSWVVSEVVRELSGHEEFQQLTGLDFTDMTKLLRRLFGDKNIQNPKDSLEHMNIEIEDQRREIQHLERQIKTTVAFDEKRAYERELYFVQADLKLLEKEADIFDEMINHPMVKALGEMIINKDAMVADISNVKHWGKTASGKVVLLDYGYSRSVAREHYGISWV